MKKTCVLINFNSFFFHKKLFLGEKYKVASGGIKLPTTDGFFFFGLYKKFLFTDVLFLFLYYGCFNCKLFVKKWGWQLIMLQITQV